ncbi:hypothetical protein GGI20_000844 [Coemansia sp. BCRC 34301]|nr:hypothetical protein GGI20_000844 [Coemansia sp. BCRC 34301]
MRTAKWVESGNASISSEAEDGASEGVIILSSSPQSDPETDQHSVESLHRVEDSPLRPTSSALTIAEKRKAVVSVKAPDYTKLAHAELQGLAEKYGLRTNTPKRLLIHQLQTIWEQTNTKRPSADITSKLPDTAVPERADEDVQPLFDQLRRHIRGNIDLFEQILCYRVLDFDAVYQDVSTAVKCQKAVLRKFFDLEGIVYSSYHD